MPSVRGLSPHTRGNHVSHPYPPFSIGSIPAHTGKPPRARSCRRDKPVYPRTHGETTIAQNVSASIGGSIPAHTGKPSARPGYQRRSQVYPRTHGETIREAAMSQYSRGLSPHTRGNLQVAMDILDNQGSIPAHTGKPYHCYLCQLL